MRIFCLCVSTSKDSLTERVADDDVDAKIKDILASCDLNGDGMISYEGIAPRRITTAVLMDCRVSRGNDGE